MAGRGFGADLVVLDGAAAARALDSAAASWAFCAATERGSPAVELSEDLPCLT